MTDVDITQDIVVNLLHYGYNGISGSGRHIVHRLFFVFHFLPSTLAHEPFN